MLLILLSTIFIMFFTSKVIIKPLTYTKEYLRLLASGDLSFDMQQAYLKKNDEFGEIARAIKATQDSIKGMIETIKQSSQNIDSQSGTLTLVSEEIASASSNVAMAIQDIAKGAGHQTERLINISTVTKRLQHTTVLYYNQFRGDKMYNQGSNYLRELIRILVRNLGILEKSEATCCGTTVSQCHAIVEIGRTNEISLNELAELLGLDKSTMSRTINNLVDTGLVIRELHPEDRRYVTIKLTSEGKSVFNTIEGSMEQYYKSIFSSIPEGKRDQVLESLQLIADAAKQNKCC